MSLVGTDSLDVTSVIKRKEARMIADAQRAVLSSARWLTAEQLSKIPGFNAIDYSVQLEHWKYQKQIFTIQIEAIDYFPLYAFNPSESFRPVAALAETLSLFTESKDDWGLAYWFAGTNGYLGGRRPQDLLLTEPHAVLDAAKDELIGITHG